MGRVWRNCLGCPPIPLLAYHLRTHPHLCNSGTPHPAPTHCNKQHPLLASYFASPHMPHHRCLPRNSWDSQAMSAFSYTSLMGEPFDGSPSSLSHPLPRFYKDKDTHTHALLFYLSNINNGHPRSTLQGSRLGHCAAHAHHTTFTRHRQHHRRGRRRHQWRCLPPRPPGRAFPTGGGATYLGEHLVDTRMPTRRRNATTWAFDVLPAKKRTTTRGHDDA